VKLAMADVKGKGKDKGADDNALSSRQGDLFHLAPDESQRHEPRGRRGICQFVNPPPFVRHPASVECARCFNRTNTIRSSGADCD
jgi:hypothetical protein